MTDRTTPPSLTPEQQNVLDAIANSSAAADQLRKENANLRERLTASYARLGLPSPLIKALFDPFEYALALRDGTIVYFEHAGLDDRTPEFVALFGIKRHSSHAVDQDHQGKPYPFIFERGLVVRISEIAWAADAPHGS